MQGFDINKLRHEAHSRWLKPSEVYFILENHERYHIIPQAPTMPPSGSLFLFNRRMLRNFRKDGHAWRKKRDGRTVGEAHEKLKVGNVDALNCYYAHGEHNPYFQRRIYWMLDAAYEHIVFVHYREVSEGRYISGSISNLSGQSFSTFSQTTSISKSQLEGFTSGTSEFQEICQNSDSSGSVEEISSWSAEQKFETYHLNTMDISGQPEVSQALQKIAEQLSLGDEVEGFLDEKLPPYPSQYDNSQNLEYSDYKERISSEKSNERLLHDSSLESLSDNNERQQVQSSGPGYNTECNQSSGPGYNTECNQSPSWNHMLELSSKSPGITTHESVPNLRTGEDLPESSSCRTITLETQFPSRVFLQNELDLRSPLERVALSENLTWQLLDHGVIDPESCPNRNQFLETDLSVQLSATRRFLLGSDTPTELPTSVPQFLEVERLHSQGTSTPVGTSSDITLEQENNIDCIGDNNLSMENGVCTSDLLETLLDPCQFENSLETDLSLTVAHNQQFSIREISPEWAFSSDRAKVIITGDFLCNPSEFAWSVMFDDIEVPLEIVQEGVLRCQAPLHCAGKVSLCITSGNRVSCSEIREFEFRADPNTSSFSGTSVHTETIKMADELLLLAKFGKIIFYGCDNSSVSKDGEYNRESKTADNEWQQIIDTLQVGFKSPSDTLDWILQELLKDKFQQWLMSTQKGKDDSGYLLSKQEQGIIHLISGLGYEWALNPILEFGVGINFRDSKGWTALHWAAHFGREKMVAALLAAGSAAGAVTDPSPKDPIGKTPGEISAARGHKGLAGYLSEAALTSHFSSLTMEESEISEGATVVDAERAVESISQRSVQMHVGGTEDELSLKDSLAAVRNAAQAAARIQAAFRAHSFRKRLEEAGGTWDEYGLTAEDILKLSAASKGRRGYSDQEFDKAALSIQKKYRGWKGRKDFLTLRQHVVKIQAIVRGHQTRKKYKEFLWTVGVVEKVVLRWRRKGVGLRGFRVEQESIDESEDEDIVKIFRKQKVSPALNQAVSRVLSMVESPEARQQYRRMLEKYSQAKAELMKTEKATSRLKDEFEIIEKDDYMVLI